MFEFEGEQFTEQEVLDAATSLNLSFDDYINKYNVTPVGKEQAATVDAASVAVETPVDGDSQQVTGSSESPRRSVRGRVRKSDVQRRENIFNEKVSNAEKGFYDATAVDVDELYDTTKKELEAEFAIASKPVTKGTYMGSTYTYTPADEYTGAKKDMYDVYTSSGQVDLSDDYFAETLYKKKRALATTYIDDLPTDIKEEVEKNVEKDFGQVQEKVQSIETAIDNAVSIRSKFEAGEELTEDEIKEYKAFVASVPKLQEEYADAAAASKDAGFALDYFKRSYKIADQIAAAFKTTGLEIASGVLEVGNMMAAEKDYQSSASKYVNDVLIAHQKDIEENLEAPISLDDLEASGDRWSGADTWAAQLFANQTPFLLAASTGNAAPYLFGAMGTTSRLSQFSVEEQTARENIDRLEKELLEATDSFDIAAIKSDIKKNKNITKKNDGLKLLTSVGHGAAEMIDGYADKLLLGGIKKSWKRIGSDEFKASWKQAGKQYTAGVLTETGSESVTQVGQNAFDIWFDNADKSYFEGLDEAAAGGFVMGNGFKVTEFGGIARNIVANVAADKKQRAEVAALTEKLNGFRNIINDPNASEAAKQEATTQRQKTEKELIRLNDVTLARFEKLSFEDQQQVMEFDRQARAVNRRWTRIAADNSLTDTEKDAMRVELEQEFNQAQEQKRAILQTTSPANLVSADKVKAGLFEEGDLVREIEDGNVSLQKVKAHNKKSNYAKAVVEVSDQALEDITNFVEEGDTEATIEVDGTRINFDQAVAIATQNEGRNGLYDPKSGVIAYMPQRGRSKGKSLAAVPLHEYMHASFASLGIPKSEFAAIREDLLNTIEDIDLPENKKNAIKQSLALYDQRISKRVDEGDITAQQAEEIGGEEIFNIIGDVIAQDVLRGNKKQDFLQRLSIRIKNLLNGKLDAEVIDGLNIDTAQGALEFVTRFQEDVTAGKTITKQTLSGAVTDEEAETLGSEVVKKIRIFDFDDTLAKSNSQVLYTLPDGTKGKLDATEYAKKDQELKEKGAEFDFSEFSKVIDGKEGPLLEVAKKINAARGNEDLFILTARPADSAGPIQDFLKSVGIEFKKENIIGLGDGAAQAKADWVQGKVDEGYNDFYFADDAIKNVNAVKDVLSNADVKSKVQQAYASEIVDSVAFEDNSINEQFKAFTHDGKVNNAPESFHAMAAYQYEPLAQAVVDRMSKIGIGKSGSKEQNNFIMDYLSNSENKADIVSALVFGADKNKASSLVGLAKTFDPKVGSFGGYAKGFLGARAIRVLQELTGRQVTQGAQTIDAPESKEIEAGEQQIEITQPVIERLKLNDKISEDLNKLGEMATIQAEKAIKSKDLSDLKKVNLRNKTFGDIFAKRLFNDVKNVLGKNTKTKSDFTDFLNNNYDALSDIALNYIDFQKGSGPASAWSLDSPPTREEFIEYYEAKNEKTSTRGDRKKSLNNAIARAISNDVRNKMVEDNPSINEGFEKVAGIPLASEVLYDLPLQEKIDWFVLLKDAKVDLTDVKLSAIRTKEEVDKIIDYQEQHVWPHVPKGFYVYSDTPTQNALNVSIGAGLFSSSKEMNEPILNEDGTVQMIKRGKKKELVPNKRRYELEKYMQEQTAIRINAFKNWGDDILLDGKPIEKYRNGSYSSTVQKPLENIAAAKKRGESPNESDVNIVKAFNKKNRVIGEEIYKRFNKAIKNDKQNAIGIASFLRLAVNDTEHFNRQLAEVVGISHTPKGRGKTYEWEHAMQQVHVAKTLLAAMLDKDRNFQAEFDAIMNNFKLIGLDNAHNHLLNQTGYKESMGKGWDVFKSSWLSRYFNDQVAEIGGIPPNSLVGLDGRTFDEIYNIDTNGNSTKAMASEVLSNEFNQMLERVKGIKAEARYSEARANKLAENKGRFKFFVPYSAEDYMGLIYPTLGKGKEGNKNLKWYQDNILKPFAKGISDFESSKQAAMDNWRSLKKSIKGTPVALGKDAVRGFSNEDAVRVYLWNQRDVVPDSLSKKDTEALVNYVNANPELKTFADQVVDITEGTEYPAPEKDWMIGTLTTDLVNFVNTSKRADFLQEWQANVDTVYSKDNLNKLKALYGENYVDALENMLYRMKTGRNRPSGQSKIENQFQNWINDSVGTVMFFNSRSAVLQTISAVNFLNWSDNNPIKAGIAFANQPQFWNDFAFLFNSDFLKQRRGGLKNDVNADEIAREAAGATNKYKAALNALLKAGFSPTQIADSFAIAVGGASFYRNRLSTYLKQGMDQKQAEEAAMLDFKETAEESQQSSRPDKVSMEQASSLGRIILAFANTPAQYTRLTKRAAQDLINGRGDWKTNVSKLLYYGAVQNIIFTALQQALFAMSFDDEEEEEEAITKVANGITDTLLRGSGVYGAGVATLKNIVMEAIRQAKSKRPDYTKAALKITTLSPPVDTKIRKLMSAGRAFTYKQNKEDMREMGWDVDNPAALAVGQVASAIGNVPLDRLILKLQNLKDATNSEYETYQRIFLALGWSDWQLGIKDDESKGSLKKGRGTKSGSLKKGREKRKGRTPAKRLERGVAGKAHRDGTIEVDPNLTPVEREKTIAHEEQHVKDIKAGKLDYDDNYVYWNGKKYPRKNGKIKYKGNWVEEGHPSLPWEKKAYDAEPSTKEIKEKKKRTKLY